MGGAASAQVVTIGEIEDVVACSLLLGRAIAAISFPDMYRIYDFHCKDAPPLFSLEDDDDDLPDLIDVSEDQSDAKDEEEVEEKKENPEEDIPPKHYKTEGLLALKVGEDTVYIEDPNRQNEAGWLPLHACCHSQATAAAGVALIEAMAASGGADWNARTARGPGPFNAGWTPLHIAAAYGVRPVAEKLLAAGADPNVENSLTWTPLLECCHRGFTHLARELITPAFRRSRSTTTAARPQLEKRKVLVDAGARVDHLPDAEVCARAPFLRAPPQAPLAEAARVGAAEIVRLLLDRGADKDRTNALGWTALHEAAFYNHAEIVQLLLVHGADATRKTAQGALAYQLTVVPAAKQALRDMGGEAAVGPDPTPFSSKLLYATGLRPSPTILRVLAMLAGGGAAPSGGQQGAASSPGGGGGGAGADKERGEEAGRPAERISPSKSSPSKKEKKKEEKDENTMLHTGGLIGDLPSLNNKKPAIVHPQRKVKTSKKQKMKLKAAAEPKEGGGGGGSPAKSPVRQAPPDAPADFLCALTRTLLRDPMRTPYGHVYDKRMIATWFRTHGSICPLTGQPLAPNELTPDDELKDKITKWQMKKTMEQNEAFSTGENAEVENSTERDGDKKEGGDDLYDF